MGSWNWSVLAAYVIRMAMAAAGSCARALGVVHQGAHHLAAKVLNIISHEGKDSLKLCVYLPKLYKTCKLWQVLQRPSIVHRFLYNVLRTYL